MAKSDVRRSRLRLLFEGGHELTLEEIASELDLRSIRHARRMLNHLRAEGAAIVYRQDGRRRRFALVPEQRMAGVASLNLTVEESLGLVIAAEASRSTLRSTPVGRALDTAFAKLLERFGSDIHAFDVPDETEHWHFATGTASMFDPAVFKTLEMAVREQRRVLIDYTTASSGQQHVRRPIEPYALALRSGTWIVVARCGLRNGVRDFSLAGITHIEVCDPSADRNAVFTPLDDFNLDAYFRERFNALGGASAVTVRLLVEPDRVVYFRRKRYHTSQCIDLERPDGRAEVSFRVTSLDEMRSFAQSWGIGVTVLEPSELAACMRAEAAELHRRYG